MAGDNVILQFTHIYIAEPFIKLLRSWVEGRYTDKHIRALAEYSFLGKLEQQGSYPAILPPGQNTHSLNVTYERSAHLQDEETNDFSLYLCLIYFSGWIAQYPQRIIESPAQSNPRLRIGHKPSTCASRVYPLKFPYLNAATLVSSSHR